LRYTDPSGHFWQEIIDGFKWVGEQLGRMMEIFPSICGGLWDLLNVIGTGVEVGTGLMGEGIKSLGNIPLLGPQIEGYTNGISGIVKGIGQTASGILRGSPSDISDGIKQVGRGIYGMGEVSAVDAYGFAKAQVSLLHDVPKTLYEAGKSLLDGHIIDSGKKLTYTMAMVAIPRNGNNGGLGYGTANSNVLNRQDQANYNHDRDFGQVPNSCWNWVKDNYSRNTPGRPIGPFSIAYTLIGTIPFAAAGALGY
jgi:hypothetical protein